MYRATRRFRFEAAHRLPDYEGKCKWLHGHSYVAEVTVESRDLDKQGMVVDFGEMKKEIGQWIDYNWDHGLLLRFNDYEPRAGQDGKTYTFDKQPTAERMAVVLFRRVSSWLSKLKNVEIVKVRIQETEDCWAEYLKPD